ncbi:Retrotransposable element Tf2 155 kDa protein type 1 [Papilio machaon]|uniref:Retrotransposable element Tf2 155 kDa protein type 1 n=1 Tax=Papilio machaon TaxID=76193 RepID=A0A194QQ83_PAPMA|nr:Retrotransposable element Tf2 155 kDa protein type 1 [Papilio machaon]
MSSLARLVFAQTERRDRPKSDTLTKLKTFNEYSLTRFTTTRYDTRRSHASDRAHHGRVTRTLESRLQSAYTGDTQSRGSLTKRLKYSQSESTRRRAKPSAGSTEGTDAGAGCFTSHVFKRFCLDVGIKHVLNTVSSPRANGQVERYNRTILDSMKAFSVKYGEKEWDCHLGKIQWGLNNTIQKTTRRTPAEVMFGTSMNVSANPILNEISNETREFTDLPTIRQEVKSRTDNEQIKQKRYYDKSRKPAHAYAEGDLVKITKTCLYNEGQSKKLMPSYIGPYRVTKILGTGRYVVAPVPGLCNTQGKRPTTVAADRMMPWIHMAALDVNENSESASDTYND